MGGERVGGLGEGQVVWGLRRWTQAEGVSSGPCCRRLGVGCEERGDGGEGVGLAVMLRPRGARVGEEVEEEAGGGRGGRCRRSRVERSGRGEAGQRRRACPRARVVVRGGGGNGGRGGGCAGTAEVAAPPTCSLPSLPALADLAVDVVLADAVELLKATLMSVMTSLRCSLMCSASSTRRRVWNRETAARRERREGEGAGEEGAEGWRTGEGRRCGSAGGHCGGRRRRPQRVLMRGWTGGGGRAPQLRLLPAGRGLAPFARRRLSLGLLQWCAQLPQRCADCGGVGCTGVLRLSSPCTSS